MKRLLILCAASLAGSCALRAAVETTTSAAAEFNLYITDDASYALASAADFAAWPVTWRSDETVTATAWDGAATTLADGTAGAASASLPNRGGVWTLANSAQGTARVGVAWAVFGDGGTLASGASPAYTLDVETDGPNRKCRDRRAIPSVAYTGDDWARGAAATSTLTFTAPDGTATTRPKTGTGTEPFAFGQSGAWTVTLAMADGTTLTATITLVGGLSVIVR